MPDQFLFRVWEVARSQPSDLRVADRGELTLDRALLGNVDSTLSRTQNAPRLVSLGGTAAFSLEVPERSAQPVLVVQGLQFESLQGQIPPSQQEWKIAPQELGRLGRLAMGEELTLALVRQMAWDGPGPTHHLFVLPSVNWVAPAGGCDFDAPAILVIGRAAVDVMSLSTMSRPLELEQDPPAPWFSCRLGPIEAALDRGHGWEESVSGLESASTYVVPALQSSVAAGELDAAAGTLLERLGRSHCFVPVLADGSRPALGLAFRKPDGSSRLVVSRDPERWLSRLETLLAQSQESVPAVNGSASTSSSRMPPVRFGAAETRNRQLAKVFADISRIASSELTVLFLGESGTGKEYLARILHQSSPRAGKPFVAVNCSAIPEQLIASELFGHVKGAFTGAEADRDGAFVAADGGTLFLDEIGDAPLSVQLSLLRALESRRLRAVGADTERPADVRVLAATSRDLADLIRQRRFREDLYFRLAELTVEIPALRNRAEDIPALVVDLLGRLSPSLRLSDQAMALLANHSWPGNVRELNNALKRAAARSEGTGILRLSDFSDVINVQRAIPLPSGALRFPDPVVSVATHLWNEGKLPAMDISRNAQRTLHRAALLYLASCKSLPEWPQPLWEQWVRLFGPKWASTEQGRNLRDLIRLLELDPRNERIVFEIESRAAAR